MTAATAGAHNAGGGERMSDPNTLWLTVMNGALGVAVLTFTLLIAANAAREWVRHHRRGRQPDSR